MPEDNQELEIRLSNPVNTDSVARQTIPLPESSLNVLIGFGKEGIKPFEGPLVVMLGEMSFLLPGNNHILVPLNAKYLRPAFLSPIAKDAYCAGCDLIVHLNGEIAVASHPLVNPPEGWSDGIHNLTQYLEDKDLTSIVDPIYRVGNHGQGIYSLELYMNKAGKTNTHVSLPLDQFPEYDCMKQLINFVFPGRWNDTNLRSNSKIIIELNREIYSLGLNQKFTPKDAGKLIEKLEPYVRNASKEIKDKLNATSYKKLKMYSGMKYF